MGLAAIDIGNLQEEKLPIFSRDLFVSATIPLTAAACFYSISRFSFWVSPDAQSYMDASAASDAWAHFRHPAFGWIIKGLTSVSGSLASGFQTLVALQMIIYLLSGIAVYGALRVYGLSIPAAVSILLCIDFGNLPILWHQAVHPELLAVAFLLLAISLVIAMAANGVKALGLIGYAVLLGSAIILRPSFLPAPIVLSVLFVLLSILKHREPRLSRACALLCAGLILVVANSSYRSMRGLDFNIVSFGGFNMSGIAGLMLTPEIVERLPARSKDIGVAILAARQAAENAGAVAQTPLNSNGVRSFRSAAIGYFDIYARTYDALVWDAIRHTQGTLTWVQFNARLQQFSIDTFLTSPIDYAAWVIGGSARTAGRMVVTNLSFGLGCLLLAVLWLAGLVASWPRLSDSHDLDWPALVLLVAAFTATTTPLMILVAFPASRYIDTSGLLLGALVLFPSIKHLTRPRPLGM